MEELIYIIDLLKEFWIGDPNYSVNISIAPMAVGMIAKAAGSVIGGLTNIAGGIIGGGKRRREQRDAQKEYDIAQAKFRNMDTSNLAANMQNTMEDLTVNTQAADFAAQQQQQAIANTMGSMQTAAGGSGIAALAQAMAGQQSQNLQQASSSIAQQEQRNQMAAAQQAASIQQQQIAGAQEARGLEHTKTSELLGMASERKTQADQAREDAKQSIMKGIGQTAGGAATGLAAAAGAKNAAAAASGNPLVSKAQGGQGGFGAGGVWQMFSSLFG